MYSFSCYCDKQGTCQGNPFTVPPCLTNIKTEDEMLCCSGQGFREGLTMADAFIFGVSGMTSAKATLLSEGRSLTISEASHGLHGSSLTPE